MTTTEIKAHIDQELADRIGTSKPDITAEWGEGAPIFRSADGYWSFKLRGRMLLDASASTGSRYDHFFYQFESDFAGDQVTVLTAYLGYRGTVGGYSYDFRAGNLFNDRSYEDGTGSDETPFLERNVVANTIIPQRGFYGTACKAGFTGRIGTCRSRSRAMTSMPTPPPVTVARS